MNLFPASIRFGRRGFGLLRHDQNLFFPQPFFCGEVKQLKGWSASMLFVACYALHQQKQEKKNVGKQFPKGDSSTGLQTELKDCWDIFCDVINRAWHTETLWVSMRKCPRGGDMAESFLEGQTRAGAGRKGVFFFVMNFPGIMYAFSNAIWVAIVKSRT